MSSRRYSNQKSYGDFCSESNDIVDIDSKLEAIKQYFGCTSPPAAVDNLTQQTSRISLQETNNSFITPQKAKSSVSFNCSNRKLSADSPIEGTFVSKLTNSFGKISHNGAPAGTGLLISAREVLTTRHTIDEDRNFSSYEVQFGVLKKGPETEPFRVVKIVFPEDPDFPKELGCGAKGDFAVLILDHSPLLAVIDDDADAPFFNIASRESRNADEARECVFVGYSSGNELSISAGPSLPIRLSFALSSPYEVVGSPVRLHDKLYHGGAITAVSPTTEGGTNLEFSSGSKKAVLSVSDKDSSIKRANSDFSYSDPNKFEISAMPWVGPDHMLFSLRTYPGASGGAYFNSQGELLAIHRGVLSKEISELMGAPEGHKVCVAAFPNEECVTTFWDSLISLEKKQKNTSTKLPTDASRCNVQKVSIKEIADKYKMNSGKYFVNFGTKDGLCRCIRAEPCAAPPPKMSPTFTPGGKPSIPSSLSPHTAGVASAATTPSTAVSSPLAVPPASANSSGARERTFSNCTVSSPSSNSASPSAQLNSATPAMVPTAPASSPSASSTVASQGTPSSSSKKNSSTPPAVAAAPAVPSSLRSTSTASSPLSITVPPPAPASSSGGDTMSSASSTPCTSASTAGSTWLLTYLDVNWKEVERNIYVPFKETTSPASANSPHFYTCADIPEAPREYLCELTKNVNLGNWSGDTSWFDTHKKQEVCKTFLDRLRRGESSASITACPPCTHDLLNSSHQIQYRHITIGKDSGGDRLGDSIHFAVNPDCTIVRVVGVGKHGDQKGQYIFKKSYITSDFLSALGQKKCTEAKEGNLVVKL